MNICGKIATFAKPRNVMQHLQKKPNVMNVKEYCVEIYKLLIEVEEFDWAKCFENFILELEKSEDKSVYRKIISIFGGMGSFNDLVLYKKGILCRKENDTLSELKKGLYNEVGNAWN